MSLVRLFITAMAAGWLGLAAAQSFPERRAGEFMTPFATDDGLSRVVAFDAFDKKIAPAQRAVVLAELWRLAGQKDAATAQAVRATVLAYLINHATAPVAADARLQAVIAAARQSESPRLRRVLLNFYLRYKPAASGPELLEFLKDPDDELRALALTGVARRPDAVAILREYVERNRSRSEFRESVEKTEFLLAKRRPGR